MRSYLIVDDNRAMAENVAEIVSGNGDQAVVAASGQEALDWIGRRSFDALLTDVRMPDMDGVDLIEEARRRDPALPVVLFTAYTHDDRLRRVKDQAPLAVLPKPVPIQPLLELLSRARRNGLLVLLEDDADLSDNFAEALRHEGFGAVTLHSLEEAETFEGLRPFAALVDLRIPGGPDGEGLRRLAARYPSLPVVVMTGHPDAAIPGAARRLFVKPAKVAEVIAALDEIHRSVEASRP